MSGVICLQGGAEFQPGCEAMDGDVLAAAPGGAEHARVLVAPFAGAPGRERELAAQHAIAWYTGLGARHVTAVFDEGEPFAEALADADLLVLPGGSPARLLAALSQHATLLAAARVGHGGPGAGRGLAISGASAGAMVLCRWTVLPETRPQVVAGLGLAPVDLVLPHFRGSTAWLDGARHVLPAGAVVLGLPERSGVLIDGRIDGEGWRGVGVEPFVELAAAG